MEALSYETEEEFILIFECVTWSVCVCAWLLIFFFFVYFVCVVEMSRAQNGERPKV